MVRGILVFIFTLLCVRGSAQSVISSHSGLVHFFEGGISIDGQAVSRINGRFPEIPEGSRLDTNDGRAEILLAPEVFLWLGRNSAIRMQRNSLEDTRVELLEGSAIVQSKQLLPGNAVTLIHKGSQVSLPAYSRYRIDPDSSEFPDGLDQWALERSRAVASDNLNRVRMAAIKSRVKNNRYRRGGPFPAVIVPVPRRTW
jgi:hypothetical protein